MYLSVNRLPFSPTFAQGLIDQSQLWEHGAFGAYSSLYQTIPQTQLAYPAPSLTQNNAVRLFARQNEVEVLLAPKIPRAGIDRLIWDLRQMSDVQKPDEECRILIAREAQIMAARLGERNSYILQNRLLSDNPKTFREIGETWGVSGQRVRQISMRIRNQLIYRMKWVVSTPIKLELADVLDQPFEWLDLGVRAHNCLQNEGIQSIGELIQKTESDLLRNRHFGPKSLNEINARLAELGLCLKKEA